MVQTWADEDGTNCREVPVVRIRFVPRFTTKEANSPRPSAMLEYAAPEDTEAGRWLAEIAAGQQVMIEVRS